jgi:hypothetical protein
MVYPANHEYLTVHWAVGLAPTEFGQFGLRLSGTPATQAKVDAYAAIIQTWWAAANTQIAPDLWLTSVKLVDLGTDGKYLPDVEAFEHTFGPAIAGGGNALIKYPLQAAMVVSLTTGVLRGRAHQGRIYVPPINVALTASRLIDTTFLDSFMTTTKTMLDGLNASQAQKLAVMSKIGLGRSLPVTGFYVDSRIDIQRRRASSQVGTRATRVLV